MPYIAQKPLVNGGVDVLPGQEVDVSFWPQRAIDAQVATKGIRYEEGPSKVEPESSKVEKPEAKEPEAEKPQTEKPKAVNKFACSECGKEISGQGKTGLCRNCNLEIMRAKKQAKKQAKK